jgi:truncated hemoglobin YjbI
VAHPPHPIAQQRYTRWLALFQAAAADVLGPARGPKFLEQAERVAASLQTGLFKPSSAPQGRPPDRSTKPRHHIS